MKMLIDKEWLKDKTPEPDMECEVSDISEALKTVEIIRICTDDFITYYCKGHVIDQVFMRDLKKELGTESHYLLEQEPTKGYFKAARNFQEDCTWYYECEPTARGAFPVTYVVH